jgi:hypothetical protein
MQKLQVIYWINLEGQRLGDIAAHLANH